MWRKILTVSLILAVRAISVSLPIPAPLRTIGVHENETKRKHEVKRSDLNRGICDPDYEIIQEPAKGPGSEDEYYVVRTTGNLAYNPHKKQEAYLDYHNPETEPKNTNRKEKPIAEPNAWYPVVHPALNLNVDIQQYGEYDPNYLPLIRVKEKNTPSNARKTIYREPKVQGKYIVNVPSVELEPPPMSAEPSNNYFLAEINRAEQYYLPNENITRPKPIKAPMNGVLTRSPKKKDYQKKHNNDKFIPVPIPIAQYAESLEESIPIAKPMKIIKPYSKKEDMRFLTATDDKPAYHQKKAEHKRKQKNADGHQEQKNSMRYRVTERSEYADETGVEDTTDTIASSPTTIKERKTHAPLRTHPRPRTAAVTAPAPDERTEFRMHGMKGPHSYEFGYDTGKGKNRQFRYEQRDNDGIVRGHYGYMDEHGKLRVVNYTADPKTGFLADAPIGADEDSEEQSEDATEAS